MIARGDMGVELPAAKVPRIQQEIIKMCWKTNTPVITATQMLDSMTQNSLPTRAEVTDVSVAIRSGTDAVMLSGETAAGSYPVEALKMMDRIISYTEAHGVRVRRNDIILRDFAQAVAGAAAAIVQGFRTTCGMSVELLQGAGVDAR